MKISSKRTEASAPAKRKKAGLSSAYNTFKDVKDEFVNMQPVDVRTLGVVAPTKWRPYFSSTAREQGLKYRSIAVTPEESVYILID